MVKRLSALQGDAGAAGAAQAPEYRVEEMTFELEEEKIPVYRPPVDDDADGEGAPGQEDMVAGASGDGHPMGAHLDVACAGAQEVCGKRPHAKGLSATP
jgi:hypothetical protein